MYLNESWLGAVVPRFFCGQDGGHFGQRVTPPAIGPRRVPIVEHHFLHHVVSIIHFSGTIDYAMESPIHCRQALMASEVRLCDFHRQEHSLIPGGLEVVQVFLQHGK
jgi:hypothetical protein